MLILNFVAFAVGTSLEGEVEKLKQELVDLKEGMSLNLKSHWEDLNHKKIVELEEENLVLKAKLEKIEKEELNPLKAKLENKIEKEDINSLRVELELKFAEKSNQEKNEKEELNQKIVELEKVLKEDISTLRKPPLFHMCAYQNDIYYNKNKRGFHTVTYDEILYRRSHRCDKGNINKSTGVFTAGCRGTYIVTWALYVDTESSTTYITLRKNGRDVYASRQRSASSSKMYTYDIGKV